MSNWFYAANGQQQGPFPDAQFQGLIANGIVRADTLVWTEGMANWQKAGEVPGLMAVPPGPPTLAGGAPPMMGAGVTSGGTLSIDFGIWDFVWRFIVLVIGVVFIIPTPWVLVWFTKWIVSCIQVPGRPNLTFTGTAGTVAIWFFGAIVLAIVTGLIGYYAETDALNNLVGFIIQMVLYWLFLKWLVANLASNGQPLGLSFSGSIWGYLGYSILAVISFITIIGWAWVYVAMARWMCRNIQGTRREVVFVGSGLELLWRAIVAVIAMCFIIPIPWMYRWMLRWWASQTQLVQRGAGAGI